MFSIISLNHHHLLDIISSSFIGLFILLYFACPLQKISISSILKCLKGGCNLMRLIHNLHMHQPIKINGQDLQYLCQQIYCTTPYIYLRALKLNTNLNLSLLKFSPPYSHIPTNTISYLISKHMEKLPSYILIKPTQCAPCYLTPLSF